MHRLTAALSVLIPWVGAQAPAPDPHWGANAFPEARTALRFQVSLNRFTEFDETGTPGGPIDQVGRFPSEVDQTIGVQMATLSWTDRLPSDPRTTYTLWLGAGYSADQPTRYLQNDFLHALLEIDSIPVGDTRESGEGLVGGQITWWSDPVPRVAPRREADGAARFGLFAGGGATGSTLFQEAEVHLGSYAQTPRLDLGFTRGAVRVGVMARGSLHAPGLTFDHVQDYGILSQAEISWVPDQLERQPWYLLGAPSLSFAASYDTGLFEDRRSGDGLDRAFYSVRAEWPNGLRVETWNDQLGGTDRGPTFGIMVGFDVTAMLGGPPW